VTYHPYEELRAEVLDAQSLLRLSTPWMSIEAEFDKDSADTIKDACQLINGARKRGPEELKISEFLANFDDHMIAYIAPRTSLRFEKTHCTRTVQLEGRAFSPNQAVRALLPALASELPMTDMNWSWDIEECLRLSRIPGTDTYDPEAAYRVFMRRLFLHMRTSRAGHEMLASLAELAPKNEPAYFEALKVYLRQYHHITSSSHEALLPIIYRWPEGAELTAKLTHEERGHGTYTESSLRELGVLITDINRIPLFPVTQALIEIFRYVACTSPLAFAMMFTSFELPGEQDEDPVVKQLEQTSRPQAARGIQKHFQFNKDGAHFINGIPLVKYIGAVDELTVVEAFRTAELQLVLADRVWDSIRAHTTSLMD
jgi:hypothetical protein